MRAHRRDLGVPSEGAITATQMLGPVLLLLMVSGAQVFPWPTELPGSAVRTAWHGVRSARPPTVPVATPISLWMACLDAAATSAVETGEQGLWRGAALGASVGGPGTAEVPAQGMLINMMSVAEADEEELNAWYDTEHVPRIAAVPGVLATRRYRATGGRPKYAAIYLLSESALPTTAAWQVAATTPWTQRIQSIRTDSARYLFDRRIDLET